MAPLALLFVMCTVLRLTAGYTSGAGSSACTSMTPSHSTNTPATGDAPYSFTVTQTDGSAITGYSAGQTLRGIRFKFCIHDHSKNRICFCRCWQLSPFRLSNHLHRHEFTMLFCSLTPPTMLGTINLIGWSGRHICRQFLVMYFDNSLTLFNCFMPT